MACETCNDKCCLISFGCILENTPLNTFADENDIMQSLILAQKDIKKQIQSKCYDELCAAIKAAPGIPIDAKLLALIDELKPPLAWKTFSYWLQWFSNKTFGDSVTTTVTDRNSNGFANIDKEQRLQMIVDANNEYESFLNEAMINIKKIGLDCYVDKDKCVPCNKKGFLGDELDYLPTVVD
jgi:hypothetical protein